MNQVHVINHTHWDREWFLTHEYTTAWIPSLIDSIERLVDANPGYSFLYDGQTLAIEDLLGSRPEYRDRVKALVADGNLTIGPLYSQPDWRMCSGELHMRNIEFGRNDAIALGGDPKVGWMVDTFGHLSQAPQMLAQFGIHAAYVWRGVPEMSPVFRWRGADGTEVIGVDLFGGYRNLYGITKTADIAVDRLVTEVTKLAPSYDGLPIPLFDGYDLDTEPEDPVRHYEQVGVPTAIELLASSPAGYVDAIAAAADDAPVIAGELLSGKYGSTFPGSLSARTYLKVLHHDAEVALFHRAEAITSLARAVEGRASIAAEAFDRRARELLQNGVHDCLCGVSIDQVHERMERSYRSVIEWADSTAAAAAGSLVGRLEPGTYAVSTTSIPQQSILRAAGNVVQVTTAGIGVTAAVEHPVTTIEAPADRFEWTNDHYRAAVESDQLSIEGMGPLVGFVIREDTGDTYSSEPGPAFGELTPVGGWAIVDTSPVDTTLGCTFSCQNDGRSIEATVLVRFDAGPLIDMTVELDSNGTGFRIDARFETGLVTNSVSASMPFDVVTRPHDDTNLLGFDVDPELAAILMGQREVDTVTEYPMHDFVALSAAGRTRAILAQGVRSYRTDAVGGIEICLRRSVEWLALSGLKLRSGDAGPAMYVPGARCERKITHRIGLAMLDGDMSSAQPVLAGLADAFHRPPLIARVQAGAAQSGAVRDGAAARADAGLDSIWQSSDLVVSSLRPGSDRSTVIARVYNPSGSIVPLDEASSLAARQIAEIEISMPALVPTTDGPVQVLNPVGVRVGASRSRPSPETMTELSNRIAALGGELDKVIVDLDGTTGADRYRLTHRRYVIEREWLELRLSLELNERRAASADLVSIPDAPDPVIADIGARLNELRVNRRIYDYVVQALAT